MLPMKNMINSVIIYLQINNLIKEYIPQYLDSMKYYKYFNNKNVLNYIQINHMYKLNNRFGYKSILDLF